MPVNLPQPRLRICTRLRGCASAPPRPACARRTAAMSLVELDLGTQVAGVFTRNRFAQRRCRSASSV
jgi:hypothetical protein